MTRNGIAASLACLPWLVVGAVSAQEPFPCTSEAFVIQDTNARLTQIDQATSPFTFLPITGPTGIEINNLGFNKAEGLLYAFQLPPELDTPGGQILEIDRHGTIFPLGLPAGLPSTRYAAGDVSPDGSTMYLNTSGNGTLYSVPLPGLSPVAAVAITGPMGMVADWGAHPRNGLLYGGDSTNGGIAVLDPATGVRSSIPITGLPVGIAYGGAWFNAAGRLFLYRNSGRIFEINLAGPTGATIAGSRMGPASEHNDSAVCVQNIIGAAKRMTIAGPPPGLPAPLSIVYTLENFEDPGSGNDLTALSAIDDLVAVFGVHGSDWTFTSISSTPASLANPDFDGHGENELLRQVPPQVLAASSTATVTVNLTLLTLAALDGGGDFSNQILATGETLDGTDFGDLSTDHHLFPDDPDPNGDGVPDERARSFLDGDAVPVELMRFSID